MSPHAEAYLAVLETLRADTLETLDPVTTPDVRFVDPFNDVVGRDAYKAVMRHMFDSVADIRFIPAGVCETEGRMMMRWRFEGRVRMLGSWAFDGMSDVLFAADGRVRGHEDFWDAGRQFHERMPVAGPFTRLLRRRIGRRPD